MLLRLLPLMLLVVGSGCGPTESDLGNRKPRSQNADAVAPSSQTTSPSSKDKATLADASDWPLFRGDSRASGVARGELPDPLELLWSIPLTPGGIESTAAIVGQVVYVGGLQADLFARNLADGTERWVFRCPSGFTASPAVKNGCVFIGDSEGTFYCIDAATGKKKWSFSTDGEINSSANFYKNAVLFGSQDTVLYGLDIATGELLWKFEGDDQIRCFPSILDSYCFLAGCDKALSIIDLENRGQQIEKIPLGSPTGNASAILDGKIYVGTEAPIVLCLDPKQKTTIWEFEPKKNASGFRSSAAVTPEAVYLGSRDKRLYALDPKSGNPLWTFSAKNRIDSSPVVVGSRVFVGSADGRLYAIDRKTGEKRWEYETGGPISASPAVASGRLVIGNHQGRLFCFGQK